MTHPQICADVTDPQIHTNSRRFRMPRRVCGEVTSRSRAARPHGFRSEMSLPGFRPRVLVAAWLVGGLLAGAPAAAAASRYDPALRFRMIATPHFFIYFHQGEEAIARRFPA